MINKQSGNKELPVEKDVTGCELRLFKVEIDSQDPIVTTGNIILEQAIKESCEEFPFKGTNIDDAFDYFSEFDAIQECEIPEDLASIYKQLQLETQRADEAESLNKELYKNIDTYQKKVANEKLDLENQLQPFQDPYFKDLSMESIAELAKKSIRLTTANSELEGKIDKTKVCLKFVKHPCEDCRFYSDCDRKGKCRTKTNFLVELLLQEID